MNHRALTRKRKKGGEEGKKRYSNWCHLPQTFLSTLLYFLSPKSRCALKATCKSWNEAKLLLPVPAGSPSSPCHSAPLHILMRRSSTTYEFLHPMNQESFHVSHYLKDAKVRYSNYGWLLMSRDDYISPRKTFLFFFNPFTKQKMELPPVYTLLTGMCFSSPPTSPDCQVFGWSSRDETALLKISEKNWRIYDFTILNLENTDDYLSIRECSTLHSPVFYRGSCYCFGYSGRIGVCDLSDNCAYTFHDTNLFGKVQVTQSILLEVDGKLLGIFKSFDEGIIFRWLDVEAWEWNPIQPDDLQDKILYLSNRRSFVQCDATTKGNGNRICIYDHRRGSPIFYSLDTKKYHSMDSTRSHEVGEITDWWCHYATWITPPDAA